MAVDQERGSRGQSGMHRQGFTTVELDQDETLPAGTVSVGFRLDAVEEGLFELDDLLDVHADDERLGRGDGRIGEDYVFELVGAGRKDRSAFVDLDGIEQVEYREMLNLQPVLHGLGAASARAVGEVTTTTFPIPSLLGGSESGEFTSFDAVQKNF